MTFMSASHSQIDTFAECERKHFYRYAKKLESKTDNDSLVRGNVVHKVLAEYYLMRKLGHDHQESMEHAVPFIQTTLDEYHPFDPYEMKLNIVNLLFWYWQTYAADNDWKIIQVEIEYKVPLIPDVFELPVVIDLIVEDKVRGLGIVDHKTCYDFFNVDKVDMDPQLPRYVAAVLELGMKPDFIMFNELRYRDTKENKADPTGRFRRTPVPLTSNRVVTVMREHLMAARRIEQLKNMGNEEWEQHVIRNYAACRSCNFKDLCDADLNGRDTVITELSFYRERKPRSVDAVLPAGQVDGGSGSQRQLGSDGDSFEFNLSALSR